MVAALVPVLITVSIAERAVRRADAQAAADAAALAGLAEGKPGAHDLATRNGANLLSFVLNGNQVTVEVQRAGVKADATATFDVAKP